MLPTDQVDRIARALNLRQRQVATVLTFLEEGATLPFLARYRKEATGSLDEVQLAGIQEEARRIEAFEKRRAYILEAIGQQGKLTDALRKRIGATQDPDELEDLYLPYKRRRSTRASKARERGLEPLARRIFRQRDEPLQSLCSPYLSSDVPNVAAALQGARDIIAEWIAEHENARGSVRKAFRRGATIRSKVARGKQKEAAKYRDYFDFEEPLRRCPSHRLLAMLRGEDEGLLRVAVRPPEEETLTRLERKFVRGRSESARQVREALHDGYQRLLAPGIETEFRRTAKDRADEEAIEVFAKNLKALLLAPPLGQKTVLGLDPGFRTGCKLVVLDASGDLRHHTTIFPHPPQRQEQRARDTLRRLTAQYGVEAIAVGNGTAGRETLAFCRAADLGRPVEVFLVNESGASIYSASEIAREEFPEQDLTVRGAVSIARRLMDPLAELVKLDPKVIGVGQYQHDVNQARLKESLDRVVTHCVNSVGINLNTASKHLLTYVSGLGPSLAQAIVDFRREHGPFTARRQLLRVPRLGPKAFEQSAGFLRVRHADHPLDDTAVHPERYPIVERMAKDLKVTIRELVGNGALRQKIDLPRYAGDDIGLPTLRDILRELERPGLDPRGQARAFSFAESVRSLEDLREGMELPGIVNNVTNFGAFVDIGIKESGLVHISNLADHYVSHPSEVVGVQQEVRVRVLGVDRERRRVQLALLAGH